MAERNDITGLLNFIGREGDWRERLQDVVAEHLMPTMHEGMMMEDVDVAFACGMIAHHQGAIDMAEVLLEHGDDPQMLARREDYRGAGPRDRADDHLAG